LKTKGINNLEPIAEYVQVSGGLALKSLKILQTKENTENNIFRKQVIDLAIYD